MNQNVPLPVSLIISGISGGIAELFTNPLDFAKVRKQLNYTNQTVSIYELIKSKGIGILFKGSLIGIQRQIAFNTIRIGLFPSVQRMLFKNKPITLYSKIISAMFTGAIAVTFISPLDTIRIQLQAKNESMSILEVIKANNLKTLYKGFLPNLLRSTIASGIQLSSYSHIKQKIAKYFKNRSSLYPHIISSVLSGLLVSVIIHPIDFCRTRKMNSLSSSTSKGLIPFLNQTIKNEGICSIYKGLTHSLLRIATWQLGCFYSIDLLTSLYNKNQTTN